MSHRGRTRLRDRIDPADTQSRYRYRECFGQVRRRVGGREKDRPATIGQRNGDRGGDGRLADPTLAHDHDQPVITFRKFLNDRGERRNRWHLDALRAWLWTSMFLTPRFTQVLIVNAVFRATDRHDPVALAVEERANKALADMPLGLRALRRIDVPNSASTAT